jgi:RNase H-fold protein (predicted Holliday junction resolvase)
MQIARSLMRLPAENIADRIAREAKLFGERLTSSEAREAIMAFLSRKK